MKRGALSEPEGALQRSEKTAKEGDAEPQLVRADPLLVFLQELSAEDAYEWHAVLLERRVRSVDDLVGLAQAEEAWNAFYAALAQQEPVLASKLLAWRRGLGLREPSGGDSPGKQWHKRSVSSFVFCVLALPLLDSLVTVGVRKAPYMSFLDSTWRRSVLEHFLVSFLTFCLCRGFCS
jgi:hypothetical protein